MTWLNHICPSLSFYNTLNGPSLQTELRGDTVCGPAVQIKSPYFSQLPSHTTTPVKTLSISPASYFIDVPLVLQAGGTP
jgi:hypothetical protein